MKTIVVVGNWSSGTTAVTGYLARMGGYTCPPTIQTSDPRTPDSHESVEFRHAVAAITEELTLKKVGDPNSFKDWFSEWLPNQHEEARSKGHKFVLLKHPLNAMLIPQIQEVCSPHFVLVTRPFVGIEQTRRRRGWAENYGAKGANVVYSAAISNFIESQVSFISIDFRSFLHSKRERSKLTNYCELWPSDQEQDNADGWLK